MVGGGIGFVLIVVGCARIVRSLVGARLRRGASSASTTRWRFPRRASSSSDVAYTRGVSFLRRMTSADYRAAVAAEAAGNVDLAAEKYALAGELDDAPCGGCAPRARLRRARRIACSRSARCATLMRWAG